MTTPHNGEPTFPLSFPSVWTEGDILGQGRLHPRPPPVIGQSRPTPAARRQCFREQPSGDVWKNEILPCVIFKRGIRKQATAGADCVTYLQQSVF